MGLTKQRLEQTRLAEAARFPLLDKGKREKTNCCYGVPPMPLIEIRALKKTYGSSELCVQALRGIDLKVEQGEFLAIMGPSGSGKSTMLHMLGGVDRATSGQVLLEGADMNTLSDDQRTILRRQRIGFIFQSFNLLPTLTAEENVTLPLELGGTPTSKARAAQKSSWQWSACCAAAHTFRRCSPAANSSVWRSLGHWPSNRRCCWPMSRRATSTPSTAGR